jgi:TolB-like protein/DNA-binding winged helix-turn-helix (wHTH) protein/Tfp pilus assembly protein PilF
MSDNDGRSSRLRFGVFEVDLRTGELRKQGLKVKLHGQPFQVLAMLLERPGELVTREEIREKLWPEDTFIDFEHSVNSSIKRLREALGDDATTPRFIETLPRHGYRFIAPVETLSRDHIPEGNGEAKTAFASQPPASETGRPPGSGEDAATSASSPAKHCDADSAATAGARRLRVSKRWVAATVVGAPVALLAILIALNVFSLRDRLLPRTPPLPQIKSIAVLPLENLSREPEQEYFADGMTEELIIDLGKIGALRVISRTSVMRYKGTKKPLPEIAKELNVDALVEGTVLRSGNRVRVTVNLLHARTDRHLWAETYERDFRDVISLQDEVAQAIARQIKVALSPAEATRLATVRTVKPEAYEFYLKGRYHYYKWTPEDFRRAIEYFQKAIEIDSDWAPAYAGLATSYGWLWIEGGVPAQEALPQFNAALKTALAIDDADPEVRYALAASAFYYRWDWEEADREFQRALALDPNLVEARFEYAWFLSAMGRYSEAVTQAQSAVDRDPLSVSANLALGDIYSGARQYDQAIRQLQHTAELEPNDFRAHIFLAGIYEEKEMYEEAISELQRAMALRGAPPEKLAGLERAYQQSGPEGYWKWQLSEAKRNNAPFEIALIYARLGNASQAVVWLEKSHQQHDWHMAQLKAGRAWDPLRSDPRFQSLLRRMNFPP